MLGSCARLALCMKYHTAGLPRRSGLGLPAAVRHEIALEIPHTGGNRHRRPRRDREGHQHKRDRRANRSEGTRVRLISSRPRRREAWHTERGPLGWRLTERLARHHPCVADVEADGCSVLRMADWEK